MTRLFLASIAIVGVLTVVSSAEETQQPELTKRATPTVNQVYVKVLLPGDLATRGKDTPGVESWIVEHLTQRGQTKFTAGTGWVPLVNKWDEGTDVDVTVDGKRWGCPVTGDIPEWSDGRITVVLYGWSPGYAKAAVTLKDEPGSRAITAVEGFKTEQGMIYVAVLIGPPAENAAAPADRKK